MYLFYSQTLVTNVKDEIHQSMDLHHAGLTDPFVTTVVLVPTSQTNVGVFVLNHGKDIMTVAYPQEMSPISQLALAFVSN